MSDSRPARTPIPRVAGSTSVLRPVPIPKPKSKQPTSNQNHPSRKTQSAATSAQGPSQRSEIRNAHPPQGHSYRPSLSENSMSEAFGRMSANDSVARPRAADANHTQTKSSESDMENRPPPAIESVKVIDIHTIHDAHSPSPPLPASRSDLVESPSSYAREWDEQPEDGKGKEDDQEQALNEPQACLFVASLAASKTDTELSESVTRHFEKWGSLRNVKVLKDWMQRPYSFVQFERVEDAQRAMAEAQNTIVDGRHIRIEQARVNRTLFIQRFTRDTTEQDLKMFLEEFGPLEEVNIFNDRGFDHRFRRYAFAKFSYRDDAIRAYVSLKSSSRWAVEWASNLSKQNQVEKESVFVGQLNPDEVTEENLRTRFQEYGRVKKVSLIKRTNALSDRAVAFAFIEFDDEQSARGAIEHANGTMFLGSEIYVQHRETTEFRTHRQQVAMQVSRAPMRQPAANTADYPQQYGPYHGPPTGDVRPIYYPAYYPYPPPIMPIPVNNGTTPAVFQGHQPQQRPDHGATVGDPTQLIYRPYAPTPLPMDHFAAATEGQTPFDHAACIQASEGLFYPRTIPPVFYVYDQGQFVAVGSTPGAIPTAPTGVSVAPFVSPNWYMPPRPIPPPPWINMRLPPAGAPSSPSLPDQGAGPSVARAPALDARGQNQVAV